MVAAEQPTRISWSDLRLRAQQTRQRAIAAGESGLDMRVADLLEMLPLPYDPEPLPDDATPEEIAEAEREPLDFAEDVLKRHGVRCRPAPGDVGPDGVVTLRPSNRYALQGAVAIAALAIIAAAATSQIALAFFVLFGAIGTYIAWRHQDMLDHITPRIVPRGRILGALWMLILLVVVSAVFVQPARTVVRERGETRDALNLAAQANAQLDAGDVAGARGSVDAALRLKPELGEVQVVRDRLLVTQTQQAATAAALDATARQLAYQRAEVAFAAGDFDTAIAEMTAIGEVSDALAKVETYRAAKQASLLRRQAVLALESGDIANARTLAERAEETYATPEGARLLTRIDAAG